MLVVVLTWATLLWALALAGAFYVGLVIWQCFAYARRNWPYRKRGQTAWAFASEYVRPPFRPVLWLACKFWSIPAKSRVGRLVLWLARR